MTYCINPCCSQRQNPNEREFCQSCGTSLIINERYKILRPLRKLDKYHDTEVFEIDNLGTTKVLKVLISDRHGLIELFEREVNILKQIQHLEVPQVDTNFKFFLPKSGKQLHCLVMEKIPGKNLQEWLKQNLVLSEDLAIDWLSQLIQFLQKLHQEKILHRDIKPSNIMLRPDGKLVLIDFGTARNITKTYAEKFQQGDLTIVYTSGYTAPEQIKGQGGFRSDFFALGRTFVHLLTGIHPDEIDKDPKTGALKWRKHALQISDELANLIQELILPIPQARLEQPKLMIEKLKLERDLPIHKLPSVSQSSMFSRTRSRSRSLFSPASNNCQYPKILLVNLAIIILVMGIRNLGWIQPLELRAFDHFMISRPLEQADSRLLIITIDESDIEYQNQGKITNLGSLSDEALLLLLNKLEQYQARTIGIDIYRDFPVNSQYPQLKKYLSDEQNIFTPCKVPSLEDGDPKGISPPPEVSPERIGFSDFVADDHEVIRRHLINLTPAIISSCASEYAFSLKLALHYLSQQNIHPSLTKDDQLKIGETTFPPLIKKTSGYQNFDSAGYQILLNYRSLSSPLDIAQRISLQDILDSSSTTDLKKIIKNRIVLIGVIAPSSVNSWKTPFSHKEQNISGVYIQAHSISQIISKILDRRPLIWWWSSWLEKIWIFFWGGVAIVLALSIHRPLYLGLAIVINILLLTSICFAIFIYGGWIPLIPPVLVIIITSSATVRLLR